MTIAHMTSTKEMYLLLPFAGSNKEATLVSRITKANFRYAYYADNNKKSCKNFFLTTSELSHIYILNFEKLILPLDHKTGFRFILGQNLEMSFTDVEHTPHLRRC